MEKNQYTEIMAKKKTEELIELYNKGTKGKNYLAPESFEAVKAELSKRELTEEQKQSMDLTPTETATSNDSEPGRYTALKTVVGLISILGYIVIIIGAIALIYLMSQHQLLIGFVGFVVSIVIALPLLAYSNLIYVFIDIEHNTRKTREAINSNS